MSSAAEAPRPRRGDEPEARPSCRWNSSHVAPDFDVEAVRFVGASCTSRPRFAMRRPGVHVHPRSCSAFTHTTAEMDSNRLFVGASEVEPGEHPRIKISNDPLDSAGGTKKSPWIWFAGLVRWTSTRSTHRSTQGPSWSWVVVDESGASSPALSLTWSWNSVAKRVLRDLEEVQGDAATNANRRLSGSKSRSWLGECLRECPVQLTDSVGLGHACVLIPVTSRFRACARLGSRAIAN